MDRLTYWNCKEKGSALPVSIGDDGDVVDLETLCAKLAVYEDIGLTPEEVEELKVIKWWSQCGTDDMMPTVFGVPVDRLRELAAADRDGRVVVLPCKVGDKVWMHEKTFIRGEIVNSVELETISEMRGNALNPVWFFAGDRDFSPSEIGKTVFLTRAGAEAALKEQEGKNER